MRTGAAAVVAVVVVALGASCGDVRPAVGRRIGGYGLRATIPRGWTGFIYGPKEVPGPIGVIFVGTNFRLPRWRVLGGDSRLSGLHPLRRRCDRAPRRDTLLPAGAARLPADRRVRLGRRGFATSL